MKSTIEYPKQDVFYWLKRPTIAEMRAVMDWANKHALRTDISFRDVNRISRRKIADKKFEEVISHIDKKAKPYFRVILRKNQNWYLLLTNEKHIEDMIEVKKKCAATGVRWTGFIAKALIFQFPRKQF